MAKVNGFTKVDIAASASFWQFVCEAFPRDVWEGYVGVVTDTVRGKANGKVNTFSVPRWAFGRGYDFVMYYAAHELAHFHAYKNANGKRITPHGPEFMREFKRICPEQLWHYEIDYKPRNAKAAGIKPKKEVK